MATQVCPAEAVYEKQMLRLGDVHVHPPILEDLKSSARARGLWNLFMPHATEWTPDRCRTSTTPPWPSSPGGRAASHPRR